MPRQQYSDKHEGNYLDSSRFRCLKKRFEFLVHTVDLLMGFGNL